MKTKDKPIAEVDLEHFAKVDLFAIAEGMQIDLEKAFVELQQLYDHLDALNERYSVSLQLPCQKGCDACCHECVFLTPLEFFYVWHWLQQHLETKRMQTIISQGLQLYEKHQEAIAALFEASQKDPQANHYHLAKDLKFTCPMLAEGGACMVYPVRELYARLFGCSFLNTEGVIYGCHLIKSHLKNRHVQLTHAPAWAEKITQLPLTHMRQVYPYYIHMFYGE